MAKLWEYQHVSDYLRFIKKAQAFFQANPDGQIKIFWSSRELDQEGFKKEFRKALDIRINLKGGMAQGSRKYSDQYQVSLMRDARSIREWSSRRVICYYLGTKELKKKYAHILIRED